MEKYTSSQSKLDSLVVEARRYSAAREASYRERALKLYPWICTRCAREFSGERLRELTVHHKDHNHDNNPLNGSNWELLCIYCHENEHARILDESLRGRVVGDQSAIASHNPFADLRAKLEQKK
ncbi:MAG: HNH nuclease family protein [Methylotenera sp.]|nr:HNH nuclease family protein [Methylotenera sp.]MSP99552.1 HNH nuclease family protein [Methylotenera sp.]